MSAEVTKQNADRTSCGGCDECRDLDTTFAGCICECHIPREKNVTPNATEATFCEGDILQGPRGGEVVVSMVLHGKVYVQKRYGWNTMSRWLRHPEHYTKVGEVKHG